MRDYVFMLLMALLLLIAMARPFVGVLLWSWISLMNVHRLSWGPAAGQPWAMLAFAATLIGCVVAGEPRRPRVTAIMAMLMLFAVAITLTSFTALADPATVWNKWDRTFKIVVGLLLIAVLLTERWRIHALVWLMVISLGFFGVRGGIFTLMTGGGFIVLGPPDTTINDRNHIAVALLFTIPLMNWLRMHSKHVAVRIGLVAAMVLTLVGAIGTQSRGALIAMVAVAAMLWLRSSGKVVSGMAIVLAVVGTLTFMPQSWLDRMYTVENYEEDASAMGRVRIWEAAARIAIARPLTGGGFRAVYFQDIVDRYIPNVRARSVHSIYFEVLGEHGFAVFGLWLGMIGTAIFYTLRISRLARGRADLRWAGDLARMSQVSIAAYLVGGTFLSLAYWDGFWTLGVVLGATHLLVRQAVTAPVGADAARPVTVEANWRGGPAKA